jgi:hypothetical protein
VTTNRRAWLRAAAALALIGGLSAPAAAALGGSAATVESDRVSMQGALMRMTRNDDFAVHEIRTATGTMVREYVSSAGTVFAVVWQGPWAPDLRQLLGDSFDRVQRSMQTSRQARRVRGVVAIDEADLVVHISGHQRSFYGRAYMPGLVPSGIHAEVIR